ncbi:MAG TPA: SSI family serine proteinase inhibitor [Gaiellaceae bacterium]|nr:SSI family serine proteinase inhibitor [Gaiellaceae bacterium]
MKHAAVALAALAALALAGCGGSGSDQGGEAQIDLKLTLWPTGTNGDSITWTLRCEPIGGDHPDAAAACAALTAVPDPFAKLPPPPRCKEIPGSSPEVALLEGEFRGRKVRSRFDRSSACVAGRWDRIAPVFDTGL